MTSRVGVLPAKAAGLGIGALLVGAFGFVATAAAVELRGAGATFPAPLYKAWIERFHKEHAGVTLRYEPVGSGEGIARFTAGVVDFAGSDVAVPTTSEDRSGGVGAQFPVTAGMVALAYNLPGVAGQLKLPRDVYADIFQGKIRRWDDPRIVAANPQLRLPARDIAVIAREESSGTTFAFTSHIATISPSWAESGIGVGKKASWPAFVAAAKGNEGVAALVKRREGAIGYVEYGYAKRVGLPVAALENKEGKFVAPSPEAGAAAINQSSYLGLGNLKASILDPSSPGAYPIVSYSWLILHWDYPAEQLRTVSAFVDFILVDGQKMALELGYVPLPAPVAYRGKAVLARIFPSESGEGAVASAGAPAAPSASPEGALEESAPPAASPRLRRAVRP
ncbi:phosphate ABC transporter substrate-binding protein PstS [Methylocystis sp. MJC1]|jgi:phosphate transport system substrate-binding protein|uniref:phosphate ABC transporter substrate-binding protein PstS n=1 Tax=Methylocystis sp. MJC1 TaxID=2654282 RepID=UPI0013ECAE90|nr:phosphate ABC transporter substrate-binding protein PstS [Methylocystis sp. MJC1]KAF2992238.1 Phosphate-binding protein PstS [Methylocystis sp. MJC1]MBU6527378.1 phosphate ABC transporter substrate-binding protein PstS [Methylocystis sp. MJC1]UZX10328.1 phosphate ABC transporter substrate-binding protein PstS [Methylocystis sp. MJC1]